jgi:hypothetical protein
MKNNYVIASEREAIQLESQEEAECCHGTSMPIISWIASLPLAMTEMDCHGGPTDLLAMTT